MMEKEGTNDNNARVEKSSKPGARKTEKKAVKLASQSRKKSGDRNLESSRRSDASQYDIHTDQSMKLKKFSSRQTRGWGPLDKLTRECLIKILDEGVKYLEERVSSQKYEDIQQQLAETRSKYLIKCKEQYTLCLPNLGKEADKEDKLSACSTEKVNRLQKAACIKGLIQQRDLLSEQIDKLQRAIEEEEQLIYKQDEVSRHSKNQGENSHCETYSSLLSRPVLELPSLPSWC